MNQNGGCFPVVDYPVRNPKDDALEWIKEYADGLGLHWETLISGADDWVRGHPSKWGDGKWWDGEYLVQGGTLEGESTDPEFWEHYAVYRGIDIPEQAKTNFFSCSC